MKAEELYECLLDAAALPSHYQVEKCCICGSTPSPWQFREAGGVFSKVVMCPNGDPVVEHPTNNADDGCLMYMPPREFYQPTRREAINFWNQWHGAMTKQRLSRTT